MSKNHGNVLYIAHHIATAPPKPTLLRSRDHFSTISSIVPDSRPTTAKHHKPRNMSCVCHNRNLPTVFVLELFDMLDVAIVVVVDAVAVTNVAVDVVAV